MATQADVDAKFAELFPGPPTANWADDDEGELYDEDGFLIEEPDDESTSSPPPSPPSPPSSVDGGDDDDDDNGDDDLAAFFLAAYDIHCPPEYRHRTGSGRSVFDGWEGVGLPAIDEEDENEYNLPEAKPISDTFVGSLCFAVGHWASQLLGL
ncbi:MAG: hypothetical protein M1836_005442 [Candelina mexicana]|nr:MAG: hypothetical protein M1836_005442 [Candelina mexicana]